MILDAIVLVVILISALISFFRGFIRETLTIVGVIGGLAAAYFGGPHLAPVFRDWLGVTPTSTDKLFGFVPYSLIADGLGYGVIFLGIVIALSAISYFISSALNNSMLGIIDRSLGIAFGVVRGLIILSLAYMPIHIFVDEGTKTKYFGDSSMIFYVEWGSDTIASYIPDFKQKPDKMFDEDMTRKTLENSDVLKPLEKIKDMDIELPISVDDIQKTLSDVTGSGSKAEPGYSNDQRDEMDQLIEQQAPNE